VSPIRAVLPGADKSELKTMRPILSSLSLVVAAAVCASASPALAQDKPSGEAIFNNTVVSTYPDGRKAELWLDRDGAYHAEGRRHDRSDGHWRLTDGKLCLKQSHPFPAPFSYCTKAQDNVVVGSTWTAKAYTGETVQIRVVSGRPQSMARVSVDAAPER
jgi:hypothetical protein